MESPSPKRAEPARLLRCSSVKYGEYSPSSRLAAGLAAPDFGSVRLPPRAAGAGSVLQRRELHQVERRRRLEGRRPGIRRSAGCCGPRTRRRARGPTGSTADRRTRTRAGPAGRSNSASGNHSTPKFSVQNTPAVPKANRVCRSPRRNSMSWSRDAEIVSLSSAVITRVKCASKYQRRPPSTDTFTRRRRARRWCSDRRGRRTSAARS